MTDHLFALGLFVFGMPTLAPDQMQQALGWRHPSNSRVGVRPSSQFIGVDDETITLRGVLYPELANNGEYDLDDLRDMADTGDDYPLLDGTGRVYGTYVITGLDIARSELMYDGVAQRIEFTLKLKRTDDEDGELVEQ